VLIDTTGRKLRQRITLTPAQIGLVLGLERVLQQAERIVICCPRCAEDGDLTLDMENGPEDTIWKMDCRCKERRILRKDVTATMGSSGDLLLIAESVLSPAHLVVRCRHKLCYKKPLRLRPTAEGTHASCECSRLQFRYTGHPATH